MHKLKKDILAASSRQGIDPYKEPFAPIDLGLNASDYGAFADYCSEDETQSAVHNPKILLRVVEWDKGGRAKKYLLLK